MPPGWRVIAPDLRGFRGVGPSFEHVGLERGEHGQTRRRRVRADEPPRGGPAGHWRAVDGRLRGAVAHAQRGRRASPASMLAATRATADSPEAQAARERMVALAAREGPAGVAKEMVPVLLGATTRREQPDLAEVLVHLITANSTDGIVAGILAIKERPDSTDLLPSITCPTLVIRGEEDALISAAECSGDGAGDSRGRAGGHSRGGPLAEPRGAAACSARRCASSWRRFHRPEVTGPRYDVRHVPFLCLRARAVLVPGRRARPALRPGRLHATFDKILDTYVRDGYVYYLALQKERGALDRYLASLDVPRAQGRRLVEGRPGGVLAQCVQRVRPRHGDWCVSDQGALDRVSAQEHPADSRRVRDDEASRSRRDDDARRDREERHRQVRRRPSGAGAGPRGDWRRTVAQRGVRRRRPRAPVDGRRRRNAPPEPV